MAATCLLWLQTPLQKTAVAHVPSLASSHVRLRVACGHIRGLLIAPAQANRGAPVTRMMLTCVKCMSSNQAHPGM
eukprot:1159130-Pelagomonas_calceolata.AAC.9